MLKLKELRLSGVGRFVEEQIINLETLGNLVQIDGQNNNTGGSSGAGKSTIFHALDYLFGLNHIPNSALKSRLTDTGITVQGTFDLDGKPLIISRGKKLRIELDGEVTTGSSKLAEEKLDEIIAIPRELFRSMLHKRQKEGGFFLKMTPREINDFLMNCLGLGSFKNKIEIIEAKVKELSEKKLALIGSLESTRAALRATQDALISLGVGPIKDIHQSVILELKAKVDKSSAELATVSAQHKIEVETLELQRPQVTSLFFDRTSLEALEKQQSELSSSINLIKSQEKDRLNKAKLEATQLQASIVRLSNLISKADASANAAAVAAEQIKKIRAGTCYTCEQPWHDKKSEEQLLKNLSALRQDIAAGAKAKEELPNVSTQLEALAPQTFERELPDLNPLVSDLQLVGVNLVSERQKEKDHQTTEMVKNRAAQANFVTLQSSLREKHSKEYEQVRGQADIDRRAFEAAVGKLRAYEEARARHEASLTSLRAQEASYGQKADELTITSTQVHNEFEMAEELKRAMKSYMSCSFDDALETISDNATKLIRNIPNMANATIQLEGIKTTQEGKIKEEVNAVIHMDGEENVDIRTLCGGERTSTDLAIDLSVIELIENRANKGIDLFVLDEPFDGLDTVCIEMALDVLKNSSLNKRLIIVDHNPEVKQMVESRLVVVRDGATSKIVQS